MMACGGRRSYGEQRGIGYGGRTRSSVQDRRQERADGLIVQAEAHQRHRLDHAKPVFQAPPEQLAVARRQEKPGPQEGWGHADEGLEVFIALSHSMAEEADGGGVACDAAAVLNHSCGSLLDRVEEFPPTLVAMEPEVQPVADCDIPLDGRACVVARNREAEGRAL